MDLYEVLGVERSASDAKIRKAYRQAALRTHPDKLGGNLQAFQTVASAFEVLACPTARQQYDCACRQVLQGKSCDSQTATKVNLSKSFCAKAPCVLARKRPSSQRSFSCKRQRQSSNIVSSHTRTSASSIQFAVKTSKALSHLHEVLKSLSPQSRLVSIESQLDENTRRALIKFIESSRNTNGTLPCDHLRHDRTRQAFSERDVIKKPVRHHDRVTSFGCSGIRARAGSYKAYVDIKALRLYTRSFSAMDIAIDHHIILVKLRHALREATAKDQGIWETREGSSHIYQICLDVFKSEGTSMDELGLSVIVSLRADRWLGRSHHISSAMMSLVEALHVHAKLLRARSASWMAFREEWVSLMLHKKRSVRNGLSLTEAQSKADVAHQVAVKHKLARAIRRVIVALGEERQRKDRALKSNAKKIASRLRQKDRKARQDMRAHKHASKWRWQWMRRRDLTTVEMLSTPLVPPKRE